MTKKDANPNPHHITGIPTSEMTKLVKLGLFFDPGIYKSVFGIDVSIPLRVPLSQSDLKTFTTYNRVIFWIDPVLSCTLQHIREKFQIKVPHSCPDTFQSDAFRCIESELSLREGYWCISEKNPTYTYMSEHSHREHAKKENLLLPSLSERLFLELLSLAAKNGNSVNGTFVRCSSHIKIGENTMNVGIKREGKNIFLAPFQKFQTTQYLGSAFVSRIM